jgi:hypothetical protein
VRDFATYLIEAQGGKDPTALNRKSVAGEWTPGDNISRLWRWAKAHDSWITHDFEHLVKPGDFYIKPVINGDHIGIVTGVSKDGYDVIDGNGKMGAVSTGHRLWTSPVRGFVSPALLIVDKSGPPVENPNPYWPPGNNPIPPIPVNWGLPVNPADSPFKDAPSWSESRKCK